MANQLTFQDNVKRQQWTNATQQSDPTPAGFTAWDANGNVTTTRALTAGEIAQLAAQDGVAASTANQSAITANVQAHQTTLLAWVAANPNGAVLTAAQTLVLAKMLIGLCNLLLDEFGSTTGT
jgi:hypothetical protein